MRIIMDARSENISEHARKIVNEAKMKNNSPYGIAKHSAQVPSVCEDCGKTYWHRDDEYVYFPHVGCEAGKKGMGF